MRKQQRPRSSKPKRRRSLPEKGKGEFDTRFRTAIDLTDLTLARIARRAKIAQEHPTKASAVYSTMEIRNLDAFELTLDDTALIKAFETFMLPASDPWSWRALLHAFCEAYFPQVGRRQKWTDDEYTELKYDADIIEETTEIRIGTKRGEYRRNPMALSKVLKKLDSYKNLSVKEIANRLLEVDRGDAPFDPLYYDELMQLHAEGLPRRFRSKYYYPWTLKRKAAQTSYTALAGGIRRA